MLYEIRIRGHLDRDWSAWFGGLEIRHDDNGETVLMGPIPDQAALHGVLAKLRDLALPLISVAPVVDPSSTARSTSGSD